MKKQIDRVLLILSILLIGLACISIIRSIFIVFNNFHANGTIVDAYVEQPARSSNKLYAPIVRYQTPDGQVHQFTSKQATAFPPKIGKTVDVVYSKNRPTDAEINSFFEMYLIPSIMVAIACILLFCGYIPTMLAGQRKRLADRMRSIGMKVKAQFINTTDEKFAINRIPYVSIIAEWKEPKSQVVFEYKSRSLPITLTQSLKYGDELTVYMNPSNPKEYWMDTTFLTNGEP